MPNYLCLQRTFHDSAAQRTTRIDSPAQMEGQMKTMYEQFNAWREKFKDSLPDMGGRLGAGRFVSAGSAPDGPFVEVKELVGGYMIVTAANIDEAIEVARACPGLVRPGSGVEVIEIFAPG